jgi:hypothetical protein
MLPYQLVTKWQGHSVWESASKKMLCWGRYLIRPAACKVLCTGPHACQLPAQQSRCTPSAWWAVSAYTRLQGAQRRRCDGSCLVHVMPRHGAAGCISLHCTTWQEQHSTARQQHCRQVGAASHRNRCMPATALIPPDGQDLPPTNEHTTCQVANPKPCNS